MSLTGARFRRWVGTAAVVLLGGAVAPVAAADSPEALFQRGNEAYMRGDFDAAQQAYQEILGRNIRDSRVFYNLANACFRKNEIGRAILYYEKALKLEPADPDARENLRFASLRIRDRVPPDGTPFLIGLLERGRNLLGLEQVTRAFLGLYLLGMGLSAVWIAGRPRRPAIVAGISAGAVLLLALGFAGWMVLHLEARSSDKGGVVLADKLEVYSGPGDENTLLASVHEGARVRIHARRGDWAQVTLPDGRAGWLREEGLGVI